MPTVKVQLFGMGAAEASAFFVEMGEPPWRGRQLLSWVYQKGELNFAKMTDFPIGLRQKLAATAELSVPAFVGEDRAADGCRRWLLASTGGSAVETVLIPAKDRKTSLRFKPGWMRAWLQFLQHWRPGFRPQLKECRYRGPTLAGH